MRYRHRWTFRNGPGFVEATRFWPHEKLWPEGVATDSMPGCYILRRGRQRSLPLEPGWYVVTLPDGDRFTCPPLVFEATYDPAEEEP